MGSLQVTTVRANPATVYRTPWLVKADDEPVLFISLQVSGESIVVQDGTGWCHPEMASRPPSVVLTGARTAGW
ncbi:hypothetical protein [Streptomyces avermitilis]|uniref:hypothetical protein n=1 Tax=Streptomyces avermitilis TaxID=33903 RepID=UPI0036D1A178